MINKNMEYKISIKAVSLIISIAIACLPSMAKAVSNGDQRPTENWQYYKEINIQELPREGQIIKVSLDRETFDHAKSELSDLRVFRGNGTIEVPYRIIVEKSSFSQENIYSSQLLNNSFIPGQYNLFIIDLGQSGYLNSSLRILTSSENFRRQAEISGSDDMRFWNVLKADGYIYDYTDKEGNFKAQNTNINYAENAYRYIQAKIFTGEGDPLTITGAQVSKMIKSEAKEMIFTPKHETRQNSKNRSTEIFIDLEKKGWPTSGVSIGVKGENFNRALGIYESADGASWQNIGSGYIFSYNTPKFKGSSLDIDYAESGKRYLKIEIYNGDDAPLAINNISASTILRNIAFQYKPGESYALYYGNNDTRFPEYDLERIFPYIDTGIYANASLGAEKNNPIYQKKVSPAPPLTERLPYLLDAVLIIMVAVMGFIVFRFMKKSASKNQ